MQTSHAMECGQNFSLFGLYSFFPSGVLATPSAQFWRKAQGAEGTGVEDLHQKIQAPPHPHPHPTLPQLGLHPLTCWEKQPRGRHSEPGTPQPGQLWPEACQSPHRFLSFSQHRAFAAPGVSPVAVWTRGVIAQFWGRHSLNAMAGRYELNPTAPLPLCPPLAQPKLPSPEFKTGLSPPARLGVYL